MHAVHIYITFDLLLLYIYINFAKCSILAKYGFLKVRMYYHYMAFCDIIAFAGANEKSSN